MLSRPQTELGVLLIPPNLPRRPWQEMATASAETPAHLIPIRHTENPALGRGWSVSGLATLSGDIPDNRSRQAVIPVTDLRD